jgi:outer membrane protein TolC
MKRFTCKASFFICALLILAISCGYSYAQINNEYNLSLEDVTKLALSNNFDIQLLRYDAMISETGEGVAESIYDTMLSAEVSYSNDELKKTLPAYGTKTVDNDYNFGLSKKIPTGTTLGVDVMNNREWTNASAASNALTHQTTLKGSIVQELGNNFLGIQDRGGVKITLLDIEDSQYTSLATIESYLAQVQKAYWDLVLENELVDVSEDMVEQAKSLYDLHQEKLQDGLVEIPEAIASEANYKKRKNELDLVRNRAQRKSNKLSLMLNLKDESTLITPTEDMIINGKGDQKTEALKQAFEYRRDYKIANNGIKNKDINLSMKKNSLWPEIDLKVTFSKNGLGDHFDHSGQNTIDEDNSSLFAGLTFSLPLENTKARSQLKAAKIEKSKALLNLKYVERKIAIGIIDSVRDCNVFRDSALTNTEIAELQAKKLEEEESRFNVGRSNTDTLIRFQEDVIRARELAALAKYQYMAALIDLEVEKGTLLNTYWEEDK